MSKFRIYFILLAIGFIFIALDIDVETGFSYPNKYSNTNSVTGEFQYYNIASNYNAHCTYKYIDAGSDDKDTANMQISDAQEGAVVQKGTKVIDKIFMDNIEVDITNDVIGFLLIFIACFHLRNTNKRFRGAMATSVFAIVLHLIIFLLPFVANGLVLCNLAMTTGLAYLACNITTTFLFAYGLFQMCSDICCRDERKWCKILWYIICVTQCLITFVFWLGSDFKMLYNLGIFFEGLLIIFIIIFWIILNRTYYYLEKAYNNNI